MGGRSGCWELMAPLDPRFVPTDDGVPPQPSQRLITCYATGMAVVFLLPIVFLAAIGLLALRGLIVG